MNVTIVGGGAAGLLTALHLLRRPSSNLRLTLIEKGERVGDGIAYATRRPARLVRQTPCTLTSALGIVPPMRPAHARAFRRFAMPITSQFPHNCTGRPS